MLSRPVCQSRLMCNDHPYKITCSSPGNGNSLRRKGYRPMAGSRLELYEILKAPMRRGRRWWSGRVGSLGPKSAETPSSRLDTMDRRIDASVRPSAGRMTRAAEHVGRWLAGSLRRSRMAMFAIVAGTLGLGLLWPNAGTAPEPAADLTEAETVAPVEEPMPVAADPEAEDRLFERIRRDRAVPFERLEVDRGGGKR